MKKIYNIILTGACVFAAASCDLDLYPSTSYNEGNVTVDEETESQYSTRADIQGLRDALYNSNIKGCQEAGYQDFLIYSECRADNAYCGGGEAEIHTIEANMQDGSNKNVARDWNYWQTQVSNANQIICNIDRIREADPSMTDKEYKEWLSEALCWRAYNFYMMSQLWGDIPMQLSIPPAITAENLDEVYHEYYPARSSMADVYARIIEDLEYAAENGPALNPSNKYLLSRAFAYGLLARVYSQPAVWDFAKVKECCEQVEKMNLSLCESYDDLWSYNDDDASRNTSESIFEVQWSRSSGNWVWMMFHRNAYNPNDSWTWAKWITPSRNLIAAYEAEGDTERKNASIIWDSCTWSTYYPMEEYAFMHKMRTNASNIMVMRLAEIYLLHAEALARQNDLSGAAEYVDRVRTRAHLADLPASASASQEAMLEAILKERRLELAFEGFRFFDLVRFGKAIEVHNGANVASSESYDPKVETRRSLTTETILLPVPTAQLENNPSLVQNPGY